MNIELANDVLEDIANCNEDYSLGFRRYIHLPEVVRANMNRAKLLLGGDVKAFLASLSNQEFKAWLLQQNT
jgi:hypothetical protein